MSKIPLRFDVDTTDERLPDGFSKLDVFLDCCNVLSETLAAQAAEAHPSQGKVGNNTVVRRGRSGPRIPELLKALFWKIRPDCVALLAEAISRSVHVKHGIKPPKVA